MYDIQECSPPKPFNIFSPDWGMLRRSFVYSPVAFREISSTAALMKLLLAIEIHVTARELQAPHRPIISYCLLLQSCLIEVSLLGGVWNSGAALPDVHRSAEMRF